MGTPEFNIFVQRQQADQSEATSFDPNQRIQEWKSHLDALYSHIRNYMAPYVAKKTAEINLVDIELNEESIGPYNVQQMLLKIGRSTIFFKPAGTMIIGAVGRVDVVGPRGTVRLVVVDSDVTQSNQLIRVTVSEVDRPHLESTPKVDKKKIKWAWKIMSPPPHITFTELTQDTFFDLILSVADA